MAQRATPAIVLKQVAQRKAELCNGFIKVNKGKADVYFEALLCLNSPPSACSCCPPAASQAAAINTTSCEGVSSSSNAQTD